MFFKKSSFKILIANLNNSVAGRMQYVKCPNTQMNRAFVMLLCRNGYLSHYEFIQSDTDHILVFFKFVNGRQCLKNLRLITNIERQIHFKYTSTKSLINSNKEFRGTWVVYTHDQVTTEDESILMGKTGIRFLLVT